MRRKQDLEDKYAVDSEKLRMRKQKFTKDLIVDLKSVKEKYAGKFAQKLKKKRQEKFEKQLQDIKRTSTVPLNLKKFKMRGDTSHSGYSTDSSDALDENSENGVSVENI